MAYRKASEETKAVALGSADFWAAVQGGGDVQISVGDIVTYLRTVLQISDVNELQAALDAIAAKAAGDTAALSVELDTALGSLGGSVEDAVEALQADVNTRATKAEVSAALGGLDGSVKTQLDAIVRDLDTRATKAEELTKDATVRADFKAGDDAVRNAFAAGDVAVRADMKKADDALAADATAKDTAVRAAFAAGDTAVRGEFAAADTAVRTDFAAADSAIRVDMKKADDALAADATAKDTAVRTAFAAGDAAVRGEFKTADDKVRADIKLVTDTLATKTALDAAVADTGTRATKQALADAQAALQADINTRATSTALVNAQAALQADINTRQTKTEAEAVRASLQADIDSRATKAQLGSAAGLNVGAGAWNVPQLQADGKLLASTLPALAITDTFPVASQAAMLGLVAERGDIAIRSDLNRCFVLQTEPASTLANWKELLTPTDAVLAVAGLTGSITASALKAALGIAIGDVAGLQGALDSLRNDMNSGLATKFDKAGGTVSGSITVTNDLKADRLTYGRATMLAISTDLNTVTTAGFYDGSQLVNAPDGSSWFYIEVQRHTNGTGYITQRVTRLNGVPEVWHRNSQGGTWGAWFRMWSSLNFDPATKADLNASVAFSGLTVNGNETITGTTSYGSRTTQHINLYGTGYGIGVQSSTSYVRTGSEFAVHQGGTHSDTQGDAGAGGTNLLRVNPSLFTYKGQGVYHTGNFNPATKADLNASVSFSALSVASSATVGSLTSLGGIWATGAQLSGAGDAILTLEDTSAPATTYRRKQIFSSKNVGGGDHWLFRMTRASDGASQDFIFANGQGGTVFTTGNFDPATKFDKAGGNLNGQLIAKAGVGGSIASRTGDGSFLQVMADAAASGQPANAAAMTFHRQGQYATWFGIDTDNEFKFGGWSEGAAAHRFWTSKNFNPGSKADLNGNVSFNTLVVAARPTWGGLTPWDNGNFDPNTKANVAGQAFSGSISAPSIAVPRTTGAGGLNFAAGGPSNTGYIEFWPAGTGARHGYIGFSDGAYINMSAEVGRFNFVGNEPYVNGGRIWHANNFNPDAKANAANPGFSGVASFPVGGGGAFEIKAGPGDGATFATHNTRLKAWWGIGIEDYAGTVRGVYDSRAGVWNTTGVPQVNGSPVWYPGNFNPGTKADLNGNVVFNRVTISENGTGTALTIGDDAQMGDVNVANTIGVRGLSSAAQAFFQMGTGGAKFGFDGGNWIMNGGGNLYIQPAAGGSYGVWHAGNFTPGSYAALNTGVRFSNILLGTGNAYVYTDGGTHNARIRTGAGTEAAPHKYFGFNEDGTFQTFNAGMVAAGNVTSTGDFIANGSLVVGNGQPYSYIEMRDTDDGTRFIHNNSGTIGFLGKDGGWKLRVFDDGAVWTAQLGDLNTRIESRAGAIAEDRANARVAKAGDTMTGDLTIQKFDPAIYLKRTDNGNVERIVLDSNSAIQFQDGNGASNFTISQGGAIYTRQFGDLNTRIEARGQAWGEWGRDRANENTAANYARKVNPTISTSLRIEGGQPYADNWPLISLWHGGVEHWQIAAPNNGELYFRNGDNADVRMALRRDGSIWSPFYGNLQDYINARADAYAAGATNNANGRVARTGDTMSGDLELQKAYPNLRLHYPGIKIWDLHVRENGWLYFGQDGFGRLDVTMSPDGNLYAPAWSNKALTTHISDTAASIGYTKASEYYEARSPVRANIGNQQEMSGPLAVQTNLDIVRGGVLRARWKVEPDGRTNLQNGDNGDQFFSVGTDGSVTTKQFGDLNNRIYDVARSTTNNKSARLAYAGDLQNDWNVGNANYAEPYGGAVITTRYTANVANVGLTVQGFRWRYLQMSDASGNWYTCGYV